MKAFVFDSLDGTPHDIAYTHSPAVAALRQKWTGQDPVYASGASHGERSLPFGIDHYACSAGTPNDPYAGLGGVCRPALAATPASHRTHVHALALSVPEADPGGIRISHTHRPMEQAVPDDRYRLSDYFMLSF